MLIENDTLYMIRGETGDAVIDGVYYGHHPELSSEGALQEISSK